MNIEALSLTLSVFVSECEYSLWFSVPVEGKIFEKSDVYGQVCYKSFVN